MRFLSYLICCMVTATSLMAKTVTPQHFGALADGVHDDTNAIQAAIDRGGKVFFPPGVYLISKKLVLYSGTTLKGHGNAVIRQTKDTFILYNEHSQSPNGEQDYNISIEGLRLDGSQVDAQSEYAAGMYFCGVKNLIIKGCGLEHIGGDGIYLGRGGKARYCENVRIDNCTFTNCGRNAANPRQSIAVVFAENVRIANCSMFNSRRASCAVDVEPNNADEHCSVTVKNCRMIGCGISSGGNNAASKQITVSKCYIDCGGTENATLHVVRSEAKIVGNTIYSNAKQNGITLVTSPSAVVSNNCIRDAAAGILVTDQADKVLIKKNRIDNCSSGIYVIRSKDLSIVSNILRIRDKGVYVRMECDGTTIEKNRILSEVGADVYSTETKDIHIINNKKI